MNFIFPANLGGHPALTVTLIMLLWFPFIIYLFMRLPGQKVVIFGFVVAWLFLPEAAMILPGIPDYTKMSATCYGLFLATFIFDVQRFQYFRLSWIDIPILIWCCAPFMSSMSNGLGLYDGIVSSIDQTVTWGFPYFLGRMYLNNLKGMRMLAIAMLVGGLAYVPLCLYEVRFSPQLHRIVYGAPAFADFAQAMRMGGFRPLVFMYHGLAVGGWMMGAALIALGLWKTGTVKKLRGIPMKFIVPLMIMTVALNKSTGAYILLVMGIAVMASVWYLRKTLPIILLICFVNFYLFQSALTDAYITDQIVHTLEPIMSEDRMGSLVFRFDNEEILVDKARQRPLFGWGGWGRNRVYDEEGNDISVTDSLWIIAYGINGLVGMMSLYWSFLLPMLAFTYRYPARTWNKPQVAPASLITVVLLLFIVDTLLNAMLNPVFSVACGGLAGLVVNDAQWRAVMQPRRTAVSPLADSAPLLSPQLSPHYPELAIAALPPSPSPTKGITSPSTITVQAQEVPPSHRETAGIGGGRSHQTRRSRRANAGI